jgi:serine phosphatase RsbU (regulator of sigma subunit)
MRLFARHRPLLAWGLTVPLIALTTWLLILVQDWTTRSVGHPVRAYGIAYIFPVALVTLLGGVRPGTACLLLSAAALDFTLIPPRYSFSLGEAPDRAEVVLLVSIGAIVIAALDASARALRSARAAEQSSREALDKAQRLAAREALLNRISESVRDTLDPVQVQRRIVHALGEALDADRCYFALYDIPGDLMVIGDDWRRGDLPTVATQMRLSSAPIDPLTWFGNPGAVVIPDMHTEPKIPDTLKTDLAAARIRSSILVPLFHDQQLAAVLTVAMADQTRDWTEEEVSLAESVAALTRSAVEIAHLHQREHNIATTLQGTLQPAIPNNVPGLDIAWFYQAALSEASVGGDFADVFFLEKGCHALVVGDLSGKGLAAAAQVAVVRNMLRFALYTAPTIADAVTRLNHVVITNRLLSGFATLVVVAYDIGARTVTHVSCGNEPVLLRRTADGHVEQLPPTGPVLGISESAVYTQEEIPLSQGDAFVLYTDGLTEAGPTRREMLGVPGLADLVRSGPKTASALVERLVAGVQQHAHGRLGDDVCLLVGIVSAPGPGVSLAEHDDAE